MFQDAMGRLLTSHSRALRSVRAQSLDNCLARSVVLRLSPRNAEPVRLSIAQSRMNAAESGRDNDLGRIWLSLVSQECQAYFSRLAELSPRQGQSYTILPPGCKSAASLKTNNWSAFMSQTTRSQCRDTVDPSAWLATLSKACE